MTANDELYVRAEADYVAVEQRVLQDNITLCDAKSGILMALAGGLIVRSLDKFFELITTPSANSPGTAFLAVALYAIASIAFFTTAFFTWYVLKPRLVKTNDYVYWGSDVFLGTEKDFIDAIEGATFDEIRSHFLRHLFILASICRRKYYFFQRAMSWAEFSLLVMLGAEIARYASLSEFGVDRRVADLAGVIAGLLHR